MSQLLVRDLAPETIERLKGQAKQRGRSLQAEVKHILEQAVQFSAGEALAAAARWREHLAGRVLSDSADLVREDRDR
jgi:plasmid stability protein